nr:zinc finger, CCHC-type [Tanacetum cinerariifolium]
MHFLLTTLKVVYALTTPMPELLEDATVEAIRIRAKWENDDYICRGHILNGMSDSLFDVYMNVESAKELWDSPESKYMAEDSSSKKFLGKEVGGSSVNMTEEGGKNKHHKQNKGHVHYKRMLEMSKDDLIPDIDENHDKCTTSPYTPQQNVMVERKNRALKKMVNSMLSYSGLSEGFWGEAMLTACYLLNRGYRAVVRLSDPKRKTLGEKDIDCIFVGYVEHSKAYRDDHSNDVPSEIPKPRKALAAIHILMIHQMDVKTVFLNGDLEEEVYMKQPEGFVIPGNEHKVCKLFKSLYGLKQAPKQWHQKFDEAVLSNGFLLNQSDKCVYSKFDNSCKGVIICLYVDDMLIFGTDQNQVDKTKKFLLSRFFMKDMGETNVNLGIKIKRKNKGIVITQSHYVEKILKKFNHEYCSLVSTPIDPVEKLKPNTGKPVNQLEYSRAIGCLMYAMTSTRLDIAYAVGRVSKFTSNHSRQHCQVITRVFKYLKGTMNYGLSYVGYPLVLEAYSDASWINHVKDSSSTSGWVFLLGGGSISWAFKKQTCITG